MPSLQNVPFGGLSARKVPNLLQLPEALYADDCYLDTDAIVGRNGYRACAPAEIGSGGAPQHMGRFRPTATSARTVVVLGGTIYLVTDPTSETATDSVVTIAEDAKGNALGLNAFAVTDIVSGAPLNSDYYLSTNSSSGSWYRLDSNFALIAIVPLPAPGTLSYSPTSTPPNVTWTTFQSLASPTLHTCVAQVYTNTGMGNMPHIASPGGWICFTKTNNGADDPASGSYVNYELPANVDATGSDWLVVGISPRTQDGAAYKSYQVQIQVAIDNAGAPGAWQNLGAIYDTPIQGGSPNAILLDLRSMDTTTRQAIRWIQFLLPTNLGTLTGGGKFLVYGYAFLPSPPPSAPPVLYYVDYYDNATGAQSPISGDLSVETYNTNIDTYPDCYMAYGEPTNSNTQDSIFGTNTTRVFNTTSTIAMPTLSEIGEIITVTTTAPQFSAEALSDGIVGRLWKDTGSGRRLVTTVSVTASGQALSFVDMGGVQVLANQVYEAGGSPPALSCLTAHAGRLVGGLGQRVHISSYIAPSATDSPNQVSIDNLVWSGGVVTATVASTASLFKGGTITITQATSSGYNGTFLIVSITNSTFTYDLASDPGLGSTATGYFAPLNALPAWPSTATADADGWSYDVYPSSLEQIQCVSGDGDNVYILTQETVYSLADLTPGSTPYLVFRRGALGAHACCYAEDRFFWASYDGVYQAEGVNRIAELTQGIRILYKDWFAPDARVSMAYQSRKLMVFQPQTDGTTRYLRYDFVTQRWTRGTLADNVFMPAFWMGTVNSTTTTTTQGAYQEGWPGVTTGELLTTYDSAWIKHSATNYELGYSPNYAPGGMTSSGYYGNSVQLYYRTNIPVNADYEVAASVYHPNSTSGDEAYGPAGRIDPSTYTCYALLLNIGSGVPVLVKFVGGTKTVLATYSAIPGYSMGTTDRVTLKLSMSGSVINAWYEGPTVAGTPPSDPWIALGSVTDSDITAAGRPGLYSQDADASAYFAGVTTVAFSSQTTTTFTVSTIEQLWLLTAAGWLSRWQPGATLDNQGSTSPTAIPDWRFSTGFLLESIPFVVKGLLLDSNETCGVTMAKTVAAANALQARTVTCPPFANIDEVWEPGCSDFRAMKMRFELSEPNTTVVNRLMFSMEAIREAHGG